MFGKLQSRLMFCVRLKKKNHQVLKIRSTSRRVNFCAHSPELDPSSNACWVLPVNVVCAAVLAVG